MPDGKSAVPAQASNVAPVVIAIKVKFELNTPDSLRRVAFGLEKDTEGDTIVWKINFQLFERQNATVDFGDAIISLDVEVDEALHANAEAVALSGLTPAQSAHALGPASDDAKAAAAGDIDLDDAKDTVQNTLAA